MKFSLILNILVPFRFIPSYLCDLFQRRSECIINTTLGSVSNENFIIPRPNPSIYKASTCISYSGSVIWNSIPHEIKNSSSLNCFAYKMLQWMKGP